MMNYATLQSAVRFVQETASTAPANVIEREPISKKAALRLVSTKDLSREQWLEVRKQGIGASDAAAAVGLNPYQSALELWMIKTGRDTELPQIDPNDMDSPMYWGTLLEPMVAEAYTRKTGHKVRRVNAVLQHPDADKHWMLANLDYSVVANESVQILECKTAGKYGAKLWEDGVPEYYQLQVQHQLAVTGKQAADICVLICGQELQIHRIERDDALIALLIEREREFWHCVETDTPPKADGSDSAGKALQALFRRDTGEVLDFSQDAALSQAFSELNTLRQQLTTINQRESELKQTLQQAMGDASAASFGDQGSVTWKASKDSLVLDTKKLLAEQPELLQSYGQIRVGSRRFLVRA